MWGSDPEAEESGHCHCKYLRHAWVHMCSHACAPYRLISAASVLPNLCPPLTCCCPLLRLLIYGEYCSHMEHAQSTLNQLLASREDFRQKVEVTGHPGTLAWHS